MKGLLILLTIVRLSLSLSAKEVDLLKQRIWCEYLKKPHVQAKCLRLSFHDCVSDRCDGCINLKTNSFNKGLEPCVEALERVYRWSRSRKIRISRADLWALGGHAAAEFGLESMPGSVNSEMRRLDGSGGFGGFHGPRKCSEIDNLPPELSPLEFRYGRTDCPTSPTTTEMFELPSSKLTHTEVLKFFGDKFGMDAEDVTAIMGAHTLGGAFSFNSGHVGKWTVEPNLLDDDIFFPLLHPRRGRHHHHHHHHHHHNSYHGSSRRVPVESTTFDNKFYQIMLDPKITWKHVNRGGPSVNDSRPQFECVRRNNRPCNLMLNTDFGLLFDLDATSKTLFKPTCKVHGGCKTLPTAEEVEEYAVSNHKWLVAYRVAWDKMVSRGYSKDDLKVPT